MDDNLKSKLRYRKKMKVTALQNLRIEGVEVCLGKVDLTPLAGTKLRRPIQTIIEKASILLGAGESADGLLPGYWQICEYETEPPEHLRLSDRRDRSCRFDTFDLGEERLPLEIPGLLRLED